MEDPWNGTVLTENCTFRSKIKDRIPDFHLVTVQGCDTPDLVLFHDRNDHEGVRDR